MQVKKNHDFSHLQVAKMAQKCRKSKFFYEAQQNDIGGLNNPNFKSVVYLFAFHPISPVWKVFQINLFRGLYLNLFKSINQSTHLSINTCLNRKNENVKDILCQGVKVLPATPVSGKVIVGSNFIRILAHETLAVYKEVNN